MLKRNLLDIVFVVLAVLIAFYARKNFIDFSAVVNYYLFDGERIFTTNDAYHFAVASKDLLEGHLSDAFYPVASMELPAFLTAIFYYILPFSLNEIMFLMPAFLAPLLAVPVYFLAQEIINKESIKIGATADSSANSDIMSKCFAFFVALLSALAASYNDRTIAGYYDTDMLILTLPMCGSYFLYKILNSRNSRDLHDLYNFGNLQDSRLYNPYRFRDLVLCAVFFTLSLLWHKSSATILTAEIFIATIYVFIARRGDSKLFATLGVLFVCISYFNIIAKVALIAFLLHFVIDRAFIFAAITDKIKAKLKYHNLIIFLIGFSAFLLANQELLVSKFALYVARDAAIQADIVLKSTSGTIMELDPLKGSDLMNKTMGDKYVFVVGFVGILALFFKNPKTLILLPMLLLSLLSLKIGSRFSMFGVVVFSLGFFYFVYFLVHFVDRFIKDKNALFATKTAILLVFGFFAISPSYYHARSFIMPPIVNGAEIGALQAIKRDSTSRRDITISWWDYGFLIPYFSNTRPIIAGTDLDGVNHFLASYILTNSDQKAAYNMSKLVTRAIEANDENLKDKNMLNRILYQNGAQDAQKAFLSNIGKMEIQDSKNLSGNVGKNLGESSAVSSLDSTDSQNIYIYLPMSIIAVETAIEQFSHFENTPEREKTLVQFKNIKRDFLDSAPKIAPNPQTTQNPKITKTMQTAPNPQKNQNDIDMESSFLLDGEFTFYADSGIFKDLSDRQIQVQAFHIVERQNGALVAKTKTYNDDKNKLHIIYSKDLEMFFAIDSYTHASLIVQFFIYENYDKNLFSLLYADADGKAFKLK